MTGDPLQDVLRKLRQEYLRDAPSRVNEVRTILEKVKKGDTVALDELRRALHKLAGSGGSYGFEAVSTASRSGERIAKAILEAKRTPSEQDIAALQATVDDLAAAFEQARQA